MVNPRDTKEILDKYRRKIEGELGSTKLKNTNYSREYLSFKGEMFPQLSRYERWCNSLGNLIRVRISEKDRKKVERALQIAHLDVEPWQAMSLAIMTFLFIFLAGLFVSVAFFLIFDKLLVSFFIFTIFLALFLFYYLSNYPARLANKWRLKASSQMVPAILYVVIYMRHTSNLERAIEFTSEHLQPPLALDFKKIFYDVQMAKYSTIKESLDSYLETWKDYSIEFIEAFHLIESSLFEPSDARRIQTLEKALQVTLDGVYDKMLKFTREVRSPLTNIYMLGVVLPTLGIALLPLASTLLQGMIKWYHVFILYNLLIPFLVFYLTENIMMKRPGGYGETQLLEMNPLYPNYKSKTHYFFAFIIAMPLILLGLLPLIFQYTPVPEWIGIPRDISFNELGLGMLGNYKLLDFKDVGEGFVAGPFGVGALILSLLLPLGIAVFFITAYSSKTRELIKEREKTKQLEKEFNSSLFQLGSRLGDGTPAEIAFGRVAQSSEGLITADFFKKVNYNIQQNGMSVDRAIFDKKRGAMIYFPSELIATSMRILVESVKKGPHIAAISLMSISEYIKNIDKINDRLRDLLAEVVSDMKSNITFLAPLLTGVVIGLAGMIATILNKLQFTTELGGMTAVGFENLQGLINIFDLSKMIPPYFLQISVGIYLIQLIFILTSTLVVVDSGEDQLERINKTGKNLTRGMGFYLVTSLVGILALVLLSSFVLQGALA